MPRFYSPPKRTFSHPNFF